MKTSTDYLMERIRKCESGSNDSAKNSNSSASGRYQYLKGTWELYGKKKWGEEFKNKNIWNGEHQDELTRWVLENFGSSDWNESKQCWSK